jgi:hypothetical protein
MLIVLSSKIAISQTQFFKWVDCKDHKRFRINIANTTVEEESIPGTWNSNGKIDYNSTTFKELPTQFKNNYFHPSCGEEVWFTVNGTGYCILYNKKTRKLSRLDKTYYRGYNFNASQFFRNDTLYSFGGYGFWHSSNILTYFDREQGEWEIIRPNNIGPKTIQDGYQGYDAQSDLFYSGASEEEQITKEVIKKYSNALYRLNLKDFTWEKLGTINSELPFDKRREILWNGQYFFQWTFDKMYIIDPSENKVFTFDNRKYLIATKEFHTSKDTIYCFMENGSTIVKYPIKQILAESVYLGPFYLKNSMRMIYTLLGGFILLVVILLVWYQKNPKKRSSIFNSAELKIINASLQREILNTQDLNEILNISNKSLDNQRRIRLSIIKQLNQKIRDQYGLANGLEKEPDDTDRRLNLYKLNEQVKLKLKKDLFDKD